MGNVDFSQVEKSNAIQQEVEASFKFIIEGIRILKTKKSAILNNHVELQLFAGGFERLAKILLFLKYKQINSKYPELQDNKNFFSNYYNGHGIKKMIDELVVYSKTIDFMHVSAPPKRDEILKNPRFCKTSSWSTKRQPGIINPVALPVQNQYERNVTSGNYSQRIKHYTY